MELITIETDRKAFGFQVKTFPDGINAAFDQLEQRIPDGSQRSYYGISWMEGETILYYAAAEQTFENEANRYEAREFTMRKGTYLVEKVIDWMNHLNSIKGIFEGMMKDPRLDTESPAIEWYKSNDEMWCMMRLK